MKFKSIKILGGEKHSRFPACTSLILNGGDTVAVIDPGAGPDKLTGTLGDSRVDVTINTHYHFDHICGNYLFPDSEIYMNPIEAGGFPDVTNIAEWIGIKEVYGNVGVDDWVNNISDPDASQTQFSPCHRHEWWQATRRPARSYAYDEEWYVGDIRMIMIHTPGHTGGFCCPYFPDEGLVYTGDIDLTGFGPWYAGSDGNIQQFIDSAQKIAQLDADWFLTGHQAGMMGRKEFQSRLEKYLFIIYERQNRLNSMLNNGVVPEDISKFGLLYPEKYQIDPWLMMWEKITIRKHLELAVHLKESDVACSFEEKRIGEL